MIFKDVLRIICPLYHPIKKRADLQDIWQNVQLQKCAYVCMPKATICNARLWQCFIDIARYHIFVEKLLKTDTPIELTSGRYRTENWQRRMCGISALRLKLIVLQDLTIKFKIPWFLADIHKMYPIQVLQFLLEVKFNSNHHNYRWFHAMSPPPWRLFSGYKRGGGT